jgi:DNA primase
MLWQSELAARPIDTPERRADLERRLMQTAGLIGERVVQAEYRRFLRERLFGLGRPMAAKGRPAVRRPGASPFAAPLQGPPPPPPRAPDRLRREVLLRMMLQHPFLITEASEDIAAIDFPEPELDRLRREILELEVLRPGLDASALRQHLELCGLTTTVERLLSPSVDHAGFLSRDADVESVRLGWLHVLRMIRDERTERAGAVEALALDPSAANWERFLALHGRQSEDDVATDALLSGEPLSGPRPP